MDTFSICERHNYCEQIKYHLNLLGTKPLTEDRQLFYERFIDKLRKYCDDYTEINPEIRDYRFRSAAINVETSLQLLDTEFDTDIYKSMLESIVFMVDYFKDDGTLSNMFNTLKIEKTDFMEE